ncbi:hypothetical protein JCM1841_000810 [Sporobolomyces salmonicolor]
MSRTAILTVGSTRFDPLVASFLQPAILSALASHGVNRILAQVGNSALPTGWELGTVQRDGVKCEVVRFLQDLEERMGRAEVVVSHAGAGSILAFLRPLSTSSASSDHTPPANDRQLILVPNSTLMDLHQSDLADEMEKKGWAIVCRRPTDLLDTLRALVKGGARAAEPPSTAYPELDKTKVQRLLDETLGYI